MEMHCFYFILQKRKKKKQENNRKGKQKKHGVISGMYENVKRIQIILNVSIDLKIEIIV